MEISGLGGGLMLAAAAGLWLVYLVPTWFRRREYLATERNAVRLQQTLRVLAETAEVPATVRAETSARSIAAQEKALREHRQRDAAIMRSTTAQAARAEAQRLAAIPPVPTGPVVRTAAPAAVGSAGSAGSAAGGRASAPQRDLRVVLARRLRRTRAVASLVAFGGMAVALVQGGLMIFTGVAPASASVLGFSVIAAVTGVTGLARLARVTRRRAAPAVRTARPARTRMSAPLAVQQEAPAEPVQVSWTPVPVPKPLYLSRAVVEAQAQASMSSMASVASVAEYAPAADPVADLREAAARADEALRAAQAAPEVTPIVTPRAPSRFAAMGVVDAPDSAGTDIDAVLRRRRVG